MSWVGENCTVKEAKAECDNQSGVTKWGQETYWIGVAKDCDWRGETESENGWEDVIGSCSGVREHSANSGGVFQNV